MKKATRIISALISAGISLPVLAGLDQSSVDSISFVRNDDVNPVLNYPPDLFSPEDFDNYEVLNPSVVKVDGVYHMLYAGKLYTQYQIGYASSEDGEHWTQHGSPVIRNDSEAWFSHMVGLPKLMWDDGQFRAWYGGKEEGSSYYSKTGMAVSPNGKLWVPDVNNPVDDDQSLNPLFQGVGKIDGEYVAYPWLSPSRSLGFMQSSDGANWTFVPGAPETSLRGHVVRTGGYSFVFDSSGHVGISKDGIHFVDSSHPVLPYKTVAGELGTSYPMPTGAVYENGILQIWFHESLGTYYAPNRPVGVISMATATFNPVLRATIDVEPYDDTNTVKNDGKGRIAVAILSDRDLDATTLDPVQITLDGMAVRSTGKKTRRWSTSNQDINNDGLMDLMVEFDDVAGTYQPGEVQANLSAVSSEGIPVVGTDTINVIN